MNKENSTVRKTQKTQRAFTIVELLAVIAMITVFIGILGLALSDSDRTAGLDSSQRILSGMISNARSHAMMKQGTVYVLISTDADDPDAFLREVRIAHSAGVLLDGDDKPVLDPVTGSQIPILHTIGTPNQLARGVYVVPPNNAVPNFSGNHSTMFTDYDSNVGAGVNLDDRKSDISYGYVELDGDPQERYLYFRYNARGFAGGGSQIIFAPARRVAGTTVQFDSPYQAVGFLLRPFGSVTFVSDSQGFDSTD